MHRSTQVKNIKDLPYASSIFTLNSAAKLPFNRCTEAHKLGTSKICPTHRQTRIRRVSFTSKRLISVKIKQPLVPKTRVVEYILVPVHGIGLLPPFFHVFDFCSIFFRLIYKASSFLFLAAPFPLSSASSCLAGHDIDPTADVHYPSLSLLLLSLVTFLAPWIRLCVCTSVHRHQRYILFLIPLFWRSCHYGRLKEPPGDIRLPLITLRPST